MSWTGFKKAVNRAGAQVYLKKNSELATQDQEFDKQETNFHKLSHLTNDLNSELVKFVENFENLIEVQLNVVKCLDSFYGDYNFELDIDNKVENLNTYNNNSNNNNSAGNVGLGLGIGFAGLNKGGVESTTSSLHNYSPPHSNESSPKVKANTNTNTTNTTATTTTTSRKNKRLSMGGAAALALAGGTPGTLPPGTPLMTQEESKKLNKRDGIMLEYLRQVHQIKSEIMPALQKPLDVTVMQPIKDLQSYNEEVAALIKKRGRKKVDYDLLKVRVDKMSKDYELLEFQAGQSKRGGSGLAGAGAGSGSLVEEKSKELAKSFDKLNKLKREFEEAESVYGDLNEKLKNEIKEYIGLRFSLIDPVFESFVKIQLKLYNDVFEKLDDGVGLSVDAQSLKDYQEDKLDDRLDEILGKMKNLDLVNA
ncbi:unnamed protein product [Ambrosiozyma monospora]|uniref:Unnamed protein product n=1 Tax=Ambrosiozyma monospora TaxID=43982 RepID=A0A9W6Z3R8_AMBMO|nr:unnamed protein product [Ambrosiozyma monospora]